MDAVVSHEQVRSLHADKASEGTSSVSELVDATAHAEVMAIRNAARKLGRHLLDGSILYSSSEPCPLCLTACYWARVSRIVFGATSHDVATHGFEDLQLYRELARGTAQRSLTEVSAGGSLHTQAAEVLRKWAESYPGTVTPKL